MKGKYKINKEQHSIGSFLSFGIENYDMAFKYAKWYIIYDMA